MSIASKIALAIAFAAGLAATSAHAAPQGFLIDLTNMTFERGSGLSAEAAAIGVNDPAVPLLKNGFYNETLTGDYTVFDNLPPSDQLAYWQTFIQISLNGTPFLTSNQIVFESQDAVFAGILKLTGLKPLILNIIIAALENHNQISTGGIFDYAYNPPPPQTGQPPIDRSHGTFAVGSTEFGLADDPLSVFDSASVSDLPNVWSLSFSATFLAPAPEPPTWVMLMAGGAGLLVIRGLASRRRVAA